MTIVSGSTLAGSGEPGPQPTPILPPDNLDDFVGPETSDPITIEYVPIDPSIVHGLDPALDGDDVPGPDEDSDGPVLEIPNEVPDLEIPNDFPELPEPCVSANDGGEGVHAFPTCAQGATTTAAANVGGL